MLRRRAIIGASIAGFSPDAQAVIDRMTGLIEAEEILIAAFVDSQVTSGNWVKMDDFIHYGLLTEANSLVGWKMKQQVAYNAPIHTAGVGFAFNGTTQYLGSAYTPSVDAVKNLLNDSMYGIFVNESRRTALNEHIFGGRGDGRTELRATSLIVASRVNADGEQDIPSSGGFQGNTLYTAGRVSSPEQKLYVNGVDTDTEPDVSDTLPTQELLVGAVGIPAAAAFFDGDVSSMVVGGGIGFDHQNYYDNLIILNTALAIEAGGYGVEAQTVLARYTGLSTTQIKAIGEFVDDEVAAGNWVLNKEAFLTSLGDVNGLIGMQSSQATNVNAAIMGANGADFNGTTNYLNLNHKFTEAERNNNIVSYFAYEMSGANATAVYGSTNGSNGWGQYWLSPLCYIRTGGNSAGHTIAAANEVLHVAARDNAADQDLYVDGVFVETLVKTSAPLASIHNFYLGASNKSDLVGQEEFHMDCIIPFFATYEAIGFDHVTHNTNVRKMLTTLGIII